MHVIAVVGLIGSGKSTVMAQLAHLGAATLDLDELSRDVLGPHAPCTQEVAAVFGADLIDTATGALNRKLLATRAFASDEKLTQLEDLELPYIRRALVNHVEQLAAQPRPPMVCAVEVQRLERLGEAHAVLDEVLLVDCPKELRRQRACARGMSEADFEARSTYQSSEEWLVAQADTIIDASGTQEHTREQVERWWHSHASR